MIGLPDRVQASLSDLDGVLTQTATLYAARRVTFDGYLCERATSIVVYDLSELLEE